MLQSRSESFIKAIQMAVSSESCSTDAWSRVVKHGLMSNVTEPVSWRIKLQNYLMTLSTLADEYFHASVRKEERREAVGANT